MNIEETLNKIGEKYSPLSIECQQELVAHSTFNTYKKGEIVVREGEYSKKAYLFFGRKLLRASGRQIVISASQASISFTKPLPLPMHIPLFQDITSV